KTVVGHDVYFPLSLAEQAEEGELSWNYFVGFKVSDVNHGFIGTITDDENSTVNTLFNIDHEGNEVLMPAQEEFIKDKNQKERTILVEIP
ncbi:MAG: 16S rRNA processing protein RimM, partial [Bacteroidaceae bacterium]|nr:16S rRNA processing protein RimM [Bacteroidaceae bacterium]